jgi:hypothetical protein
LNRPANAPSNFSPASRTRASTSPLSIEFGRPTFLLVRPEEAPLVITPLMESEMVGAMTWVENIETWEDAGERRWENVLQRAIGDG